MAPTRHTDGGSTNVRHGIVLDPWRAVYVPIPKVGCTSLLSAIRQLMGIDGEVHVNARFPVIETSRIRTDLPDYTVFAFVRNPWDRLLSCYLNKLDPGRRDNAFWCDGVEKCLGRFGDRFSRDMSFAEFIFATAGIPDEQADAHFAPQFLGLIDANGEFLPHHVGRYESLEADFHRIRQVLGMPSVELPRRQTSRHGHYGIYYDAGMRQCVERRHAGDIERFGYAFETSRDGTTSPGRAAHAFAASAAEKVV